MKSDPDKRTLWEERIAEYHSSGLSGLQWCKKNHVTYSTFKCWRAKIAQSHSSRSSKAPITHNSFIELKDLAPCEAAGVEIVVGKATIKLHKRFDEAVLKSCLCILGG
jgi:hypothetical protein